MSSMGRGIFKDEKAATVVFGTLLIILVTITLVSGLALVASLTMKQNAERQAVLDAAKNENLKIVTIRPTASSDPSYWDSLNITVLNLDILDADLKTISINSDFIMNYFLLKENGEFERDINGNPKIFNAEKKITVPAEESVQIHVGGIPILGTVNYNGLFTPLNNSPSVAYPNISSSGWLDVYDSIGNHVAHGDFTVTDNQVAANNVNISGSLPNGNYNVTYTTFLNGKLDPKDSNNQNNFKTTHSLNVEIMSDRINLFSKRFMPPTPVADVQSKTDGSGNYLLLDGSKSNDLDGFITDYQWDIYSINNNATPLSPSVTKHGNTVQMRPPYDSNVLIDLTVTNNYGMVSKLSDVSGKITIP